MSGLLFLAGGDKVLQVIVMVKKEEMHMYLGFTAQQVEIMVVEDIEVIQVIQVEVAIIMELVEMDKMEVQMQVRETNMVVEVVAPSMEMRALAQVVV